MDSTRPGMTRMLGNSKTRWLRATSGWPGYSPSDHSDTQRPDPKVRFHVDGESRIFRARFTLVGARTLFCAATSPAPE
jgi:hypothetical protein